MRRVFLCVLLALSFAMFSVPESALAVIPSTPNLYSPAYGGNVSGTVVNFSWYAANGAVDYYFELATDAYFSYPVAEGWTGGGTGVQMTGMDDDGQIYYWRVTAYSYDGEATSSTWYFYNGPSAAPAAPSVVSPSYGANVSGTTVSLHWSQAARANNYYLQVSTNSSFTNNIVDEWVGDYIGINLNLLDDGTTYYWRVKSGNSKGSSSYTSTYYFVNGPSAAPATPSISSPSNGTNVSGTQVLISWNVAARANNYYVQVATDSGFANKIVDEWVGDYTGLYLTLPDDGSTYYWRVLAGNSKGNSSYTSTYYFVNGPSAAPPTPTIASPSYGANVAGTQVLISWNVAARANNYYVQVATDSAFTNKIVDEWVGDYTGLYLTLPDDGTTYYWRVLASNSRGSSSYTSTYYFVNGPSAAPATPTIISPTNGANVSGTQVLIQWNVAARANNYYVQVATDSGFVNKFVDEWVGDYTGLNLTLPDDGSTYYWRVAAGNSKGTSNYIGTYSFVNGPSAIPAVPALSSPSNGANVSGTTVALQWAAVARANNYYIQVATDAGFTDTIVDEWIGDYIGINLNLLDDGQVYYWRVAAGNSLGSSNYSATYHFTNGPSAVPATPTLTSPGNSTKIDGPAVSFQWSYAARANNYRLQLAIDSSFNTIVFDEWVGDYIGIQLTGLPDNGQQFYWRVAAGNSLGSSLFPSGLGFVNGPSAAPAVPTMATPTNGAMASGPNVTFYWNPAPRANDYRLQLAVNSGFTEIVFDEWVGDYLGMQFSGAFRDIGDQFYWRVSARNSLGESSFPYAWYFINGPSSVPAGPSLVAPGNNSNAAGSGINFYWQQATRAEYYDIQVATDVNFNNIFKEDTVIALDKFIDGFDDIGRDYYWRVAGINSLGTGPFSGGYKFTNGAAQECTAVQGTGLGLVSHVWSNGTRFIDTCKDVNNNYFLKDISRRLANNPFGHNGKMNPDAEIRTEYYDVGLMQDADNNWNATNQASGVDAHQHTSIVYDFLLSTFNLNSFDGVGSTMLSIVELPHVQGEDDGCPNNAFWDGENINFCAGSGQPADSATLDVVGHEWAHAVTHKASNRPLLTSSSGEETTALFYQYQSGALNEAFSDWMGVATERYYRPTNWNWTIGEGVELIRDLSNPPAHASSCNKVDVPQPDSMSGYVNCSDDNGGVHLNSGIPNKMFFLLSAGGMHPGTHIQVQGIGVDKAIQIALKANRERWRNDVTFLQALDGMVAAAEDLFTPNSFEVFQVKNAWAAVGVSSLPTISTSSAPAAGGTTTGGGTHNWGDSVTVTATPNSGYLFKNWTVSGAEVSTSASYTFTVNGSRSLVANFVVVPPTISVTPTSLAFGSVTVGGVSTSKTITVTNNGSQPLVFSTAYRDGTNPAEFLKYSDSCSGQSIPALGSCSFQMQFTPTTTGAKSASLEIPSNDSTTPVFQVQMTGTGVSVPVYTITASAGVGGSISPSGTVSVLSNGSQSYTITVNIGFHVTDVKIDGTSQGVQSTYTFSNVTANHTIEAVFAIDIYSITTSVGPGGTISPTSALVSYGGSQAFSIAPNNGYSISSVLVDGISQGAITGYTFTNVTSPHSISATFTANTCSTLPVSIVRGGYSFNLTYSTLQDGYDAALTNDIIETRAVDLVGNFNFNRNITVTLDGGYACDYLSKMGNGNIKGSLTISSGTVIVNNMVVSN